MAVAVASMRVARLILHADPRDLLQALAANQRRESIQRLRAGIPFPAVATALSVVSVASLALHYREVGCSFVRFWLVEWVRLNGVALDVREQRNHRHHCVPIKSTAV